MRIAGSDFDVTVVRWPAESAMRAQLASRHRPRLLLVQAGAEPPELLDELEDWLREPVDAGEVVARSAALRDRAAARRSPPRLDEDGLLHHDGRWVAIPPAQLPIVALLVDRFGTLVRNEELTATYTAAGGTANRSSLRTAIMRVRLRVGEVGLELEGARQRGVVLQPAAPRRG